MNAPSPLKSSVTTHAHVLGRLTAAVRAETGLSQKEVELAAQPIGLNSGALCRIETGRNIATIDDVVAIEAVFSRPDVAPLLLRPLERSWLVRQVAVATLHLEGLGVTVCVGKRPPNALSSKQLDRALSPLLLRWRR